MHLLLKISDGQGGGASRGSNFETRQLGEISVTPPPLGESMKSLEITGKSREKIKSCRLKTLRNEKESEKGENQQFVKFTPP